MRLRCFRDLRTQADYDNPRFVGKLFGFDIAGGKINIKGSGTPLITFTARPDIGSYLAYVLTSLPREKLEWRSFCIEGDRVVSSYKPIS